MVQWKVRFKHYCDVMFSAWGWQIQTNNSRARHSKQEQQVKKEPNKLPNVHGSSFHFTFLAKEKWCPTTIMRTLRETPVAERPRIHFSSGITEATLPGNSSWHACLSFFLNSLVFLSPLWNLMLLSSGHFGINLNHTLYFFLLSCAQAMTEKNLVLDKHHVYIALPYYPTPTGHKSWPVFIFDIISLRKTCS